MPAPFLDTACPDGWRAALQRISAVPFERVIPGHGTPLTRAQFLQYREAFESFIACAASERAADQCAREWTGAVAPLQTGEPAAARQASAMAASYIGLLRAHHGNSPFCAALRATG